MVVITDSTVDLPRTLIEKYGIEVVPLRIQIGQDSYRDYFEIDVDKFYYRLRSTKEFPRTTQPSPQDFIHVYKKALEKSDCLFSIHISSKLSGTYQSAMIARQQFLNKRIHVIDSRQTSVGLGLIVLAVAEAVNAGKGETELLEFIEKMVNEVKTYFSVDSLEYLNRGGRIGKAQAFLGTMLKIKPLLTLRMGEVYPVEKIRGRQKLLRRMSEIVKNAAALHKVRIGLIYTDNEEELSLLNKYLGAVENIEVVYRGKAGGVITSHVGPGTIGFSFYPSTLILT